MDQHVTAAPPTTAFGVLRRVSILAPDLTRDLRHVSELSPLVVLGELVALLRAREAALRRKPQPLEIDVLGGLVDAALDNVLVLELWRLAGDEAENGNLAL